MAAAAIAASSGPAVAELVHRSDAQQADVVEVVGDCEPTIQQQRHAARGRPIALATVVAVFAATSTLQIERELTPALCGEDGAQPCVG